MQVYPDSVIQLVLIESDWNLKFIQIKGNMLYKGSINRIRLEFKAEPFKIIHADENVLIESDWNLKSIEDVATISAPPY